MAASRRESAQAQTKTEPLIKSRNRVRDLAEVYTAEREVRAMLDLVPEFSLKQTFLEPACGNGNFLIEILRRKLQAHAATRPYFERDSDGRLPPFPKSGKAEEVVLLVIQAVSTINGFDIGPLQPGHPTRNKNRENCGSYCLDLPDYLVGHTVLFIERLFGVRDDGA